MLTAGELPELSKYIRFPEQICERLNIPEVSYLYVVEGGKLRVVSPLFARLLNYTPEELVGLDCISLIHPDKHMYLSLQRFINLMEQSQQQPKDGYQKPYCMPKVTIKAKDLYGCQSKGRDKWNNSTNRHQYSLPRVC